MWRWSDGSTCRRVCLSLRNAVCISIFRIFASVLLGIGVRNFSNSKGLLLNNDAMTHLCRKHYFILWKRHPLGTENMIIYHTEEYLQRYLLLPRRCKYRCVWWESHKEIDRRNFLFPVEFSALSLGHSSASFVNTGSWFSSLIHFLAYMIEQCTAKWNNLFDLLHLIF